MSGETGPAVVDQSENHLINNSLENWNRVLAVNLNGVMLSNRAVARHMVDQGIAGTIVNQTTSFLLAGLSVTQLIFFAESAVLILRSSIPLSLGQLVGIFFLRTIIALPLLAIAAHLLV